MKFINRERELADLEDLWSRPGAQLVIVYGRRRTGKTTLLARFVQDKPHLFWVADRFPAPTLLGDLSRAIYRFVAPYREDLEQGYLERAWQAIDRQLNAFVGTTFESLCRQWVRRRGREGHLPFVPERVGSYWDRQTQVDVVALNWSQQTALLGEARWTSRPLGVPALNELRAKTSAVLPDPDWHVHYALFSRSGFTDQLTELATREHVWLVALEEVLQDD